MKKLTCSKLNVLLLGDFQKYNFRQEQDTNILFVVLTLPTRRSRLFEMVIRDFSPYGQWTGALKNSNCVFNVEAQ